MEEIDLRAEASPEPSGGSLSRIIAIFSHVLLQLFRKGNPEAAAKASSRQKILPSTATLAAMVSSERVCVCVTERGATTLSSSFLVGGGSGVRDQDQRKKTDKTHKLL